MIESNNMCIHSHEMKEKINLYITFNAKHTWFCIAVVLVTKNVAVKNGNMGYFYNLMFMW